MELCKTNYLNGGHSRESITAKASLKQAFHADPQRVWILQPGNAVFKAATPASVA